MLISAQYFTGFLQSLTFWLYCLIFPGRHFFCVCVSRGFCLFLLRRQSSTSWPLSKTCCVSACSPHPSCSLSANSSPSSTTNCPGRRLSTSSRYDLVIAHLSSTIMWDATTCSDLLPNPDPCCSAFRRYQTWSRPLRTSLTWPARWDQVPYAVGGVKVFGHLLHLWCDVLRQVSLSSLWLQCSLFLHSCQHLPASCSCKVLSCSVENKQQK